VTHGRLMIIAVILDGFHASSVMQLIEYVPVLRVPRSRSIKLGQDSITSEPCRIEEYKACFHAADRQMVLYSTNGDSQTFLDRDWVVPAYAKKRELNWFVRVEEDNE
jgi:hypothetical protein